MVDCFICGVLASTDVCHVEPECHSWWLYVRFLHFDLSAPRYPLEDPGQDISVPWVTGPGKVLDNLRDPPHQECPYIRIPPAPGADLVTYNPFLSRVMGRVYPPHTFPPTSACYPVHSFCWDMFTFLAGARVHTYPPEKLMLLYRVLGSLPFTDRGVEWGSQHGDYQNYYSNVPIDYGAYANNPTLIPAPSTWFPEGIEAHPIVLPPGEPRTFPEVPTLFPGLSPDAYDAILSRLDLPTLIAMTKMEAPAGHDTHKVMDPVWEGLFDPHSDMGFMASPAVNGSWIGRLKNAGPNINWHSVCIHAQRLTWRSGGVQNRKRIWGRCIEISKLIDDIYECEQLHFDHHVNYPFLGQRPIASDRFLLPRSKLDLEIPFIVQVLPQWEHDQDPEDYEDMRVVSTRGLTDYCATDEIGVTFVGTGQLKYLTGLYFLRNEARVDGIGWVNERKMKRVKLNCAAPFSITVAANQNGIVDISIAESGLKWLGGGVNLKGAATMRRTFHPLPDSDQEVIQIAAIVDLDAYRIKRLGFLSPSLVIDNESEALTCQIMWKGNPPIEQTVNKSLNGDTYCGALSCVTKPYDPTSNKATLSKELLFEKIKRGSGNPFGSFDFGDHPLEFFTCYVDNNSMINGLTFCSDIKIDGLWEMEWTIGYKEGTPVSFPLDPEQDEGIKWLGVIFKQDIELLEPPMLSGFTMYTTCDRRFHLDLGEASGYSYTKKTFMPKLGHKITGLYGEIGFVPSLKRWGILGLGTITTIDPMLRACMTLPGPIAPGNAQFNPRADIVVHGPIGDYGLLEKFISHVDFTGCKSIDIYMMAEEAEDYISGFVVKYRGDNDKGLPGKQVVVGRIMGSVLYDEIEFDEESGERLTEIRIHEQKSPYSFEVERQHMDPENPIIRYYGEPEGPFSVHAIELYTSSGNCLQLPCSYFEEEDRPASNIYKIKLDVCQHLLWVFGESGDWIKGFESDEKWFKLRGKLIQGGVVVA
ncbi:hypothetical protein TWF718_006780 [Orbilia javanica]|uniref:Uncharacterized protein n=1 Tax=Orbilia javanica TaxID=47235 RepID=A0AAN8NUW9_9PEZI